MLYTLATGFAALGPRLAANADSSSLVTTYGWWDTVLFPLKWLVAWVLVIIHRGLTAIGLPSGPGVAWILAIVLMTVFVRLAIFPLFTKQIRSQRAMQTLAPEMKKLQARYKGKNDPASKQLMQQEMMALYKEHGTSPFSSCLPILVQIPIFAALFRVLAATAGLENGTYPGSHIGPLDKATAIDINRTELFGANMIESFNTADSSSSRMVIGALILIMVATQFITMRQISMKNMPAAALEGPQARMQKTMMYVMPLFIGFTGFIFQVGLLIYMVTTNLFTMFQQIWAINKMPTPGSEAYRKWHAKQQAKYDAYFSDLVAQYDTKIAAAEAESETPARATERKEALVLERDNLLRARRVKLGLEDPKKVEAQRAAAEAAPRVQPKRLARAERKAQAAAARAAAESEAAATKEELARQRYERRAAERAQRAENRKKKEAARRKRLNQQGKRPGDLEIN